MRAVIMAGGKGTRLWSVAADIPKPMFSVLGKPILEYQIESLVRSGIRDITLIVGYRKESIIDFFGNGERFGVRISYIEESEPLGTAGALYFLKGEEENFVLLFGDLILDIDFNRFMKFHQTHHALITLYGHSNAHPCDSDVLVVDRSDRITEILRKKSERNFYYYNFVNAGIYCVSPEVLTGISSPIYTDLEKTVISNLIGSGKVFAYRSVEYVKDMGTPDRLRVVSSDIENGIVAGRSLKRKQKAIFLKSIFWTSEIIKKINVSGYLAIGVIEQSMPEDGATDLTSFEEMQKKIDTELGKDGACLDDRCCLKFSYENNKGLIPEERTGGHCPISKIKDLGEIVEKYHIDLAISWYIGSKAGDVAVGNHIGLRTILVQTCESEKAVRGNVIPDCMAESLSDAVHYILG